MKISHIADVPLMEITHAREGSLSYHRMLEGRPGDPGNFVLTVSKLSPEYNAPRHRHNFDQFRVRLTGEYDYSCTSEGTLDVAKRTGAKAGFDCTMAFGRAQSIVQTRCAAMEFGRAARFQTVEQARWTKIIKENDIKGD
mgnify:CR=1 FL=1